MPVGNPPDIRLISPTDVKLSASIWLEPNPNVTLTAQCAVKNRVVWRNKGFFADECLNLIELILITLKRLEHPLPTTLLNYLAELEAKRAPK